MAAARTLISAVGSPNQIGLIPGSQDGPAIILTDRLMGHTHICTRIRAEYGGRVLESTGRPRNTFTPNALEHKKSWRSMKSWLPAWRVQFNRNYSTRSLVPRAH